MGNPREVGLDATFDLSDPATVGELAQAKRFLEVMRADREFREAIRRGESGVLKSYSLNCDIESLRPLWDPDLLVPPEQWSETVLALHHWTNHHVAQRDLLRAAAEPANPRFREWRRRQIARCDMVMGAANLQLPHIPLCFELSSGCSVGCWFCGIDAKRFNGHWLYQENRDFWREMLETVKVSIGTAAATGICYWATDPFDNPDYLEFVKDFNSILGRYPQTTTALAARKPEVAKELLSLTTGSGVLQRFSVVTLRDFQGLMREFTAEELLDVQIVAHNPESADRLAVAGRAWKATQKKPELRERISKPHVGDRLDAEINMTIACVSGLLINTRKGEMRVISPCLADKVWPNGYRVYGRWTFSNPGEFKLRLQEALEAMQVVLPATSVPQVSRGLTLEQESGQSVFRSPVCSTSVTLDPDLARNLGKNLTLQQIASDESRFASIKFQADRLFDLGLLDDEPEPLD